MKKIIRDLTTTRCEYLVNLREKSIYVLFYFTVCSLKFIVGLLFSKMALLILNS